MLHRHFFVSVAFACGCVLMHATTLNAQPKNASEANRKLIAELLREVIAKELQGAKIDEKVPERHKEEKRIRIDFPKVDRTIVTYWWSEVAFTATFPDVQKKLSIEVPEMIRQTDGTTLIKAVLVGPIAGDVAGKAMSDDKRIVIIAVNSGYSATLRVEAEIQVQRIAKDGESNYKVEVKKWTGSVHGPRFANGALDRLRGPIEGLVNRSIQGKAEGLRGIANGALQKAYQDGKLKLLE